MNVQDALAAEPTEVSFSCDAPAGVSCDDVREELAGRLAEAGRAVGVGTGLPRATVTASEEGRARVEIEVSGRRSAIRDVDLAGDPAPAWTIALTIEQVLALEEAAAARRDRPHAHTAVPGERAPQVPSELWIGLAGGARMDVDPGVAILGGGLFAWTIDRLLLRVRAYGEYAPHEPFRGDAFGLGTGAGWSIVMRRSLRLSLALEALFRMARWQYDREAPELGPELGAGAWVDATFGRWVLRPWATIGLETFFLRQRPIHTPTGERLEPSLVSPTAQVGLVFHP